VDWTATQFCLCDGRRYGRLVEGANVRAGRHDLIDLVEDLIGEHDIHCHEEIVELFHGAGTEQCARDARMSNGERHGQMRHRHSGLLGKRDEPLDGVEAALVAEHLHHGRAPHIGVLAAAHSSGEHALPERPPDENAHPVSLRDRENLTFDAATEDRIRRLVGAKSAQTPALAP
jgi:hypothetical protein